MKICILSDSHDNRKSLAQVMERAVGAGVECILHCGDVIAPNTLRTITKHRTPLHVIHGNNAGDLMMLSKFAAEDNHMVTYYGRDADINLAGRRIFMVHYPHYAEAMATTGRYDLVCCGHTHHARIDQIPNINGAQTMLINPGNTAGIGQEAHFVLGDLSNMQFTIHAFDE